MMSEARCDELGLLWLRFGDRGSGKERPLEGMTLSSVSVIGIDIIALGWHLGTFRKTGVE